MQCAELFKVHKKSRRIGIPKFYSEQHSALFLHSREVHKTTTHRRFGTGIDLLRGFAVRVLGSSVQTKVTNETAAHKVCNCIEQAFVTQAEGALVAMSKAKHEGQGRTNPGKTPEKTQGGQN